MRYFVTDIGTEELAHLEMVAAIVHQLTKDLSMDEIENSGFATYYVDHTVGIWPQAASGIPFSAYQFQSTGDIITDLMEDMAAEQKARTTYDNILRLIGDQDVCANAKSCTSRDSVKPSASFRITLIPETSTLAIPVLTATALHKIGLTEMRYKMPPESSPGSC